jgi:hypothetical protein
MKKVLFTVVMAMALLVAFSLMASGQEKTMSWKGWISDSHCGAKGMSADHKDCAQKCVKEMGAKYVFVPSDTKQVIPIHNQDAVKGTEPGHEVTVTGHMMKDKSLHIDKIEG